MGRLFANAVFPAWHWLKRDGINSAMRELEGNQWLASSEIQNLQQRKLGRLLAFAGSNVPYYRQAMRDAGITVAELLNAPQHLRCIPILTKQLIRQHHDLLVSEDLHGNQLRPNSTSGSTGEAMRFFTDARSVPYRQAAEIRSDTLAGWNLGERVVRLWGATLDRDKASRLRGRMHALVTGRRFLSSFDLSDATLDEYIALIRRFRPTLLVGYPGPLEQLAARCEKHGTELPSIRSIVSSAETLWPHQRKLIENAIGMPIFDRYGCREVGQIAGECAEHDGLHVSSERVFLELVDDRGDPCGPGEEGRLLVTDLDNWGMPLIRYEIGDRATWNADQPCRCGRGLPRLKAIQGRTLDVVVTPDGRRIGGTFWTLLLRSRAGVRQFQVIQESIAGVVVRLVPDTAIEPEALRYFETRIHEYCGEEFGIEFVLCDAIDKTTSGKQRLIVSHVCAPTVAERSEDAARSSTAH